MTTRQIENRIKKLNELAEQRKAIEEQEKKIREEITNDLESKGLEEMQAGKFIVRWKEIISNRFDSKSFKKDHADIYSAYTKQSTSMRFTVA